LCQGGAVHIIVFYVISAFYNPVGISVSEEHSVSIFKVQPTSLTTSRFLLVPHYFADRLQRTGRGGFAVVWVAMAC
jgi:hypothetical protein